jgi:hypothetical protein
VHRVPPARAPLKRLQSNISSRTGFSSGPSINIQPALPSSLNSQTRSSNHPRNVSSSSEFPMREDSYAAREISQRVIDPSDEPTSLPPNLPYPQLQQVRHMGMRSSPSSASMASMASTSTAATVGGAHASGGKRGFFSALRHKKDGAGLGPPTGPVGANGSGSGKKDVRGLQISNPERTSLSGPSPMGPRGPRMGSFNSDSTASDAAASRHSLDTSAPYRASLNTSMGRLAPPSSASIGRASFDSSTPTAHARTNVGSRLQQAASGAGREDEVRAMQEVLPHVERGVLRAYLAKHGDQMTAITYVKRLLHFGGLTNRAYFEDEKRGLVRT